MPNVSSLLIIQAQYCDATICRTHLHLDAEWVFIVTEMIYAPGFWADIRAFD